MAAGYGQKHGMEAAARGQGLPRARGRTHDPGQHPEQSRNADGELIDLRDRMVLWKAYQD
jgi:hypothetical protein